MPNLNLIDSFRIGDRVEAIAPCDDNETFIGATGVVRTTSYISRLPIVVDFDDGRCWSCEARSLKNLTSKKSFMKKVSVMMKKLLDADTQTLVKAGYINSDLELTSEGQKALTTILFMANKADMVAAAQEVITEAEAESKK